jgi:hypothetical protein
MAEQRREEPVEPPLSGEITDFTTQLTRTVAENAANVFRMIGNAAFVAADTMTAMADMLGAHRPEGQPASAAEAPPAPKVPPHDIPKVPAPADIPEVPDQPDLPTSPPADIPRVPEPADIPKPPTREPENPDELPVPGWDQLTVGSIRARLGRLGLDQLLTLRAYEQQHAARPVVVTMLDNRIAKVRPKPAD